ncbi:MAG: DUF1566 domain-containing protein [Elusimicrobiales bacterium]
MMSKNSFLSRSPRFRFSNLLISCFCLLPLARESYGQSVHAFNSGMNCNGVYRLPDTSTRPVYHSGTGDDSYYQPVISSPSYTNNGDGTTTDNVTGLMWARGASGISYTWANALYSCTTTMNSGSGYAGYKDWRLPNIQELISIVDYGLATEPCVNGAAFPGTVTNGYLSSTTSRVPTTEAMCVMFNISSDPCGRAYGCYKTSNYYVRCVRGGQ